MVALVLSAWHIVGAQQITDFLPSSPDIPGFTIPTLSVFLLSPPLLPPGSQSCAGSWNLETELMWSQACSGRMVQSAEGPGHAGWAQPRDQLPHRDSGAARLETVPDLWRFS